MIESVIWARDHLLAPNGLLFPARARLFIEPFTYDFFWQDRVQYWNNCYGFDFSPLIPLTKKMLLSEPAVDQLEPENQLARCVCIKDIDLMVALYALFHC